MVDQVKLIEGESMNDTDLQLLKGLHSLEKKMGVLENKIDDSINGRFKDMERRIENLETTNAKLAWAIVLGVITAVLSLVIKVN